MKSQCNDLAGQFDLVLVQVKLVIEGRVSRFRQRH
jgi:hypothetical protein